VEHQARIGDAREAAETAIATAEGLLRTAELHLVDVDDRRAAVAVGDDDGAELQALIDRYTRQRDDASAEIDRQQATLDGLDRRLAEARNEEAVEEFRALQAQLDVAGEPVIEAARGFSGVLAAAVKQAAKLVDARAAADELRLQAERAGRAVGLEVELIDEPSWRPDGWEILVQLVQGFPDPQQTVLVGQFAYVAGGPRTPLADGDARRALESSKRGEAVWSVEGIARESFQLAWRERETEEGLVERALMTRQQPLELRDAVIACRHELIDDRKRQVAEYNARTRAANASEFGDAGAEALAGMFGLDEGGSK
jgi:hypothetical protein